MNFSRSLIHYLSSVLITTLLAQQVYAVDIKSFEDSSIQRGQSEYFNTNKDQRFTIKVNLVGGVQNPGIYHFPDTTNLVEALSLAGGTVNNADLSKVYVKRLTPEGYQTARYDLSKVVGDSSSGFPAISDKDTILIETSNASQTWLITLTILSLAASAAASAYVIAKH